MSELSFVIVEDRGPVRRLTLNNPGHKNAIPAGGWSELAEAIESFASSDHRVLVLRGSGTDFCSGAELRSGDLDDLASPAEGRKRMRGPSRVATSLFRLSKPSVAAVDGIAFGAGMSLAIGCDVVVAASRARFSTATVKRGLNLDAGGTWLLPRLVGIARARELALTGREMGGSEAVEIGLVARVVEPEMLDAAVEDLALELAAGAPLAQRFIKVGLARSLAMTFEQGIAYENQTQATLLTSDDAREGVAAFIESREPKFHGS